MYLSIARSTIIAVAIILSCKAVSPGLRGEDVFDTSSHQFSDAIKHNSIDGTSVSQDGRFLFVLIGSKGFTWDVDSKKIMAPVDLEIYDRRFVGKHGFIGTLELEQEAKKNIESDEYHIDLIPAGSSKSTRVATHVEAGHIEYCALSPTGKQLAYQSRNWEENRETVTVIEVASGSVLCRFAAPEHLQALAWSSDEKAIILGNGADLQVFDLDKGPQTAIASPRQISALQTSTISRICVTELDEVVVGHDDENLRVYTFRDRTLKLRSTIKVGFRSDELSFHSKYRTAVVFSSYGNGDCISFVDIDTETVLLRGKSVQFSTMCSSSDQLDFVVKLNGILCSYSFEFLLQPLLPTIKSPISKDTYDGELQFGDTPQDLLRASRAGFSRWRVDNGLAQVVGNHPIESLGIEDGEYLHFSGDLGYLVRSENAVYACRWDDASKSVKNKLLLKFPSYPRTWDNNSQSLVQFHDEKSDRYRLAVLDSEGKLSRIVDPAGGWDNVSLSPDRSLIVVSDSRSVSLLDIAGKEYFQKECDVDAVDPPMFSSDKQRIIYGPSQIDAESGSVELVYPFAGISATAVSPNEAITAYGHMDGRIFLFNQLSKSFVVSLGQMEGAIQSLCFHRDGRYVAALDGLGTIYVWDTGGLQKDASSKPLQRADNSVALPLLFKSGSVHVTIDGTSASRNEVSEALRSALRQVDAQ